MNRYLYLVLSVFFLVFFTVPVKRPRITSTFGETRIDHIHNGVDFAGDGQAVYSVLPGQIVFYWQQSDYPLEQSFGYGNYIILQHGNQYRSFYYHLQNGFKISNQIALPEGFLLAYSGNSGHSSGAHLHFTITDIQDSRVLNPLSFMGSLKDSVKPVITDLYYSADDKNIIVLRSENIVEQSNIFLYVKCYDKRNTTPYKMGINQIYCYVNGKRKLSMNFNILDIQPYKGAVLPPDKECHDIYYAAYVYRLGQVRLLKPVNSILIKVSDYNGNETEKKIIIKKIKKN